MQFVKKHSLSKHESLEGMDFTNSLFIKVHMNIWKPQIHTILLSMNCWRAQIVELSTPHSWSVGVRSCLFMKLPRLADFREFSLFENLDYQTHYSLEYDLSQSTDYWTCNLWRYGSPKSMDHWIHDVLMLEVASLWNFRELLILEE